MAQASACESFFQQTLSLGEARGRTSIERTVVWRSRAGTFAHAPIGAETRKRNREAGESGSVAAPVEMRLQKLGDGRRFERCPGSGRRRHSTGSAQCEAGMITTRQDSHQGNASPECPEVIGAPAHKEELNRNSRTHIIGGADVSTPLDVALRREGKGIEPLT